MIWSAFPFCDMPDDMNPQHACRLSFLSWSSFRIHYSQLLQHQRLWSCRLVLFLDNAFDGLADHILCIAHHFKSEGMKSPRQGKTSNLASSPNYVLRQPRSSRRVGRPVWRKHGLFSPHLSPPSPFHISFQAMWPSLFITVSSRITPSMSVSIILISAFHLA